MVRIIDLKHRFGTRPSLRKSNFERRSERQHALDGLNIIDKSTLLGIVTGALERHALFRFVPRDMLLRTGVTC